MRAGTVAPWRFHSSACDIRARDIVDDPVEVAGVGTGFEGTLSSRLRNAKGQVIAEKSFQAGGTGIWGNFFFRIDVPGVPERARGTLEVFESSAEDGSDLHKRVIPILFGRALVDPFAGFAVHTVQSGETLSGIATDFYGDGQVPDHLRRQPPDPRRPRRDRARPKLRIPQ